MWRKRMSVSLLTSIALLLSGCFLFNRDPVAGFTASVLTGVSPLTVSFDASGSVDPDGRIASYKWDFGDGDSATGITTTHTFTATVATTFTVVLMVTDDDGGVATRIQSIEVRVGSSDDPNGPTARFTASPTYGDSPLTVRFDASGSVASDGSIDVYGWDFGDESTASGQIITHTFETLATTNYTVTLTVKDTESRTGSAIAVITVIVPEDVPSDGPTADFTASDPVQVYASPSLPQIPSLFEVTFDPADCTASPGHTIEYYVWNFGDGESLTRETNEPVTHTYASGSPSRTYVVTLTVIDEQGLRHSAVRNVTVTN